MPDREWEGHSFDLAAPFVPNRKRQISIGVITVLDHYATLLFLRKRRLSSHQKASMEVFVAIAGLLTFATFNAIVSTCHVMSPWNIVMDNSRWLQWFQSEPPNSYLRPNRQLNCGYGAIRSQWLGFQ